MLLGGGILFRIDGNLKEHDCSRLMDGQFIVALGMSAKAFKQTQSSGSFKCVLCVCLCSCVWCRPRVLFLAGNGSDRAVHFLY